MAAFSVATGRSTATKVDVIGQPRIKKSNPVVVFCHSGAGDAREALGSVHPSMLAKTTAIVDAGYSLIAVTQPVGFGNGAAASTGATTCQGVVTDGIAYHRANLLGTADPIVLVGCSMGSTTVLRRAGLAPSAVACVVTFLTVADLTGVYQNDATFTYTDEIGAAYGVTPPAALPASTCPVHQLTDTVPKLVTFGGDDTFSTYTGHVVTDEMTGRGAAFRSVLGASHDDDAVSGIDTEEVVEFIRAHT